MGCPSKNAHKGASKTTCWYQIAIVLLLFCSKLSAAHFVDQAALFSEKEEKRFEKQLTELQKQTGVDVVVYVGKTARDETIEAFSQRLFIEKKIGFLGKSQGILFVVLTEQKESIIVLGYGLDDFPDSAATTIVDEKVAPKLGANAPKEAVEEGVSAIFSYFGRYAEGDSLAGTSSIYRSGAFYLFIGSIPFLYLVARFAPTRFFFLSPLIGFCVGITQSLGLGISLAALGIVMVVISSMLRNFSSR